MKKFNFKSFLTGRDKNAKVATLLTEGLTDIQRMVFPHVDMNNAVKFLRVMPGWKNSTLNAEIELNFSDDKKIEFFRDKCNTMFTAQDVNYLNDGFQQDVKSGGGAVTVYELAKPENLPENLFEQFCSQMFATVMRFFKTKNIAASMRIVKRDGGKILIKSEDGGLREATWKKIDDICGNKAIFDGIAAVTAGMAEMKTTKDAARKDQLKPEMKKRGDDIMAALNAIPAESELSDEDRAKIESSTKTEESRKTVLYKGNCEECFYVYLIYLYATAGDKVATETLGLLNTVYTGSELRRIIGLSKIIETGLSYYALAGSYKEIADGFIKNVRLTGDVSETQRKLLQMLNALVAPRPKDWAENINKQIQAVQAKAEKEQDAGVKAKMQQELTKLNAVKNSPQPTIQQVLGFIKDNHLGLCIVNYLKNRAQEIKSVRTAADTAEQNKEEFDVDAAMAKIRPDITRYGDLTTMFEAVINDTKNIFSDIEVKTAAAEAEKQRKIYAMKTAKPQLKNKVAARRQKLFEAVRAYGGEVFADENWTASICLTSKQLGVFGRNKPKTASDRKTILPGVNLEDKEGITATNKAIRDGKGPWIADGISQKFDTQETETCWCVCGAYCNHDKSINTQTPRPWGHTNASNPTASHYAVRDNMNNENCLVQFMDNNTGRLFMLGCSYILDEADGYTGSITGDSGIPTLKQCCRSLPSFNQFVKDSGLWDRFAENKKTKVKTDTELMSEAIAAGIITDDGEMHLTTRSQLNTYSRLIERVSKINIETENAERFFTDIFGETVLESLVVDCRRVKNADLMFKGIHAKTIILENTENIESMQSMFADTITENIQGLDTRSVKDMQSAFYNCRQKVFKMVSIPALDLRKCQDISHCFEKSYISSVNMQNTDNITNAIDAFVDMPLLQSIPDVKFKNVMSPKQLRYDFNGDYVTIFDGCDKLLGGKKFDEEILKIEKFYQHPERKNKFTDERGYLIIRNQTDVAAYAKDFYKYPGVVLDKNIPSTLRLFHDISHMKIRVLDVNGLPILNELIYRCQTFSIGAIVGTQNVINAEKMFAYSSCSICPRLSFPALRGQITVFRTMYPFGNVNSNGFFETGAYVQPFPIPDDENYVENVARNLFGETIQEWRNRVSIENAVEGLYTSKIENRRNILKSRYKTGEDGFIEISDLADFSENIRDILELKPKGLRFSRELVETLNKLENLPNGIWSNASAGRLRDIPKLDLNGLANASNLFKGAILGRIDGIVGLESVVQGDSMFENANIGNLSQILRGQTFAALKSANSMFRSFKGSINIQDMKFPVLESAGAMFLYCSISQQPQHTINFQRVTSAKSMFCGCNFGKIQSVDMPNAVEADRMFADCTNLESIGTVTMPRCRSAESIFFSCRNLKVIGELELGQATNVDEMFAECVALKNIHICRMNAGSANTGNNVFYNCPLSEIYNRSGEPFFARAKLLNR